MLRVDTDTLRDRLKFYQSQAEYYKNNLGNAAAGDRDMITGIMHYYDSEVRQVEEEIKRRTSE